MLDLLGRAIADYFYGNSPQDIETETSISEIDVLPVSYLFRDYDGMNPVEQKALDLSAGKVLDVGCGAGSHALYLQDEKNLEVTAIDISPLSVEVAKKRGVENAVCCDILEMEGKFDTVLLLMNGTGIFKSLHKIDLYLQKLKMLLNDGGSVLIDSTDIIYMYDRDDDGGYLVPAEGYYGELDYFIYYKKSADMSGTWLYLDFNTLKNASENNGFNIEKVLQDDYSFLAKLSMA